MSGENQELETYSLSRNSCQCRDTTARGVDDDDGNHDARAGMASGRVEEAGNHRVTSWRAKSCKRITQCECVSDHHDKL